jgi:hypothetical protein
MTTLSAILQRVIVMKLHPLQVLLLLTQAMKIKVAVTAAEAEVVLALVAVKS